MRIGHRLGVALIERVAVASERDRRLDQRLPRQLAEAPMRKRQPRDRAGYARGLGAEHAVFGQLTLRVEVHRLRRGSRGDLAKVDRGALTAARPHEHETAAAQIAAGGMRHRAEARRDRGIDRCPPRLSTSTPTRLAFASALDTAPSLPSAIPPSGAGSATGGGAGVSGAGALAT